MKLSEFIEGAGRPVAYYPRLARIFGGVKQAVLLCQLIYWVGKSDREVIHKTAEEIEEETGLTYEEQKVARAYLKKIGVLKDSYARLDHWVNFEIDFDRFNDLWERRAGIGVYPDGEKADGQPSIGANHDGSVVNPASIGVNPVRHRGKATFANNVSETTSEITKEEVEHATALDLGLAPIVSKSNWGEDEWLRQFLIRQKLVAIPDALFFDPAWWERISIRVNGISEPFLERTFAALGNHFVKSPQSRPLTRRGWLQKLENFLIKEREIIQREQRNVGAQRFANAR